ncbi:MAG: hypothetical protein ACI30I_07380 [Parabacteroides sp.]
MITKEITLGKVSPVGCRQYDAERPYDVLDIVEQNGQSYLSLHDGNSGNNPESDADELHWMLLAQRGESWYQMCVRTGRFSGSEDEFLDEKQAQIDAAAAAADKANESSRQASENASYASDQAKRAKDIAVITEELYRRIEEENIAWIEKEEARQKAESDRVIAENRRNEAEVSRAQQETMRGQQYDAWKADEDTRVAAENERSRNESIRIQNENDRQQKETERQSSETERKSAELNRERSEESRNESESLRNEAETAREQSEASRIEQHTQVVSACESAARNANDAALSAVEIANAAGDSAIKKANDAATNAMTVANDAATNATNQADYAKRQGDYAKEQGDAAKVLNDKVATNESNIGTLQGQVSRLELFHDPSRYAVAAWDNDDLNPVAIEFQGNKKVADDYKFMLIDTSDNTRKTTAWKELKRNNLLRFADDTFAPTVGITQDMYDACAANALYILDEDGVTYSEAYASGSYDAEAEWTIDKASIQSGGSERTLYILEADGITYTPVSHKLRPWETVETKYTIGIGMDHVVYLMDNVKGKSGKTWQGLFLDPVTWDGIDVTPWKLEPTAISPCPVCTVGGKSRAFFYLYEGEGYCAGYSNYGCNIFKDGRTYPRHTDMSQVNDMNFSRANNSDNTLPYPFAEGGYHALNTYNNALEVLYETRYIHGASRFGTGISSLDSSNNEANWLANGGARYRAKGTDSWTYGTWSSSMSFYTAADLKTKLPLTACVNGEAPKEQCMESQMAFSYAMELGVEEGVKFSFYGSEYWYKIVPDTSGTDKMNVRVYRIKTGTANLYNASGELTEVEIECCLRMSLFGGANLSGDVFCYWGGGYEQVGTCVNVTQGSIGHPVKLYIQPDQLKWLRETAVTKDDFGEFEFEREYIFAGDYSTLGNSYAKSRAPYTVWKTANGGSTSNGMCFYEYDYNYWSSKLNQRVRIASRFRGYAYYSNCSRRFLNANYSAAYPTRYFAGSAQALIDAAGPLQAE